MLPKIQSGQTSIIRNENIALSVISEDHLRGILAKCENKNYKPWRNRYAPLNPHTPFGDFPPDYMFEKTPKLVRSAIYEDS